jgi:TatD DNase family protein
VLNLTDTHCHIHTIEGDASDPTVKKWRSGGITEPDEVVSAAMDQGVSRLICVGTELEDSKLAVQFVQNRENCWASVGVHPHDGAHFIHTDGSKEAFEALVAQNDPKVVAIGECGLDFYYENSPKADQIELLHFQLKLAEKYKVPVIFHIRDAFDEFWPIFDRYSGLRGVIHSFTGTKADLDQILKRGLYVGLNGIMTFTKDKKQLEAAKAVPLERLLVETDAPYLTPAPLRGKICKPENVKLTATFLAALRGEEIGHLARETTNNACYLFGLTLEKQ